VLRVIIPQMATMQRANTRLFNMWSMPDVAAQLILPPDSLIQQRPGARHRALRLDHFGVRALFVTGAWLARSFFRGAPPDGTLARAVAAIRRRLTERAATSPQASGSGGK
jgi:hypothetical protein